MCTSEFWKLTPFEFYRYVDGYNRQCEYEHDSAVFMMYNNAALSQMGRKMPQMKKFLMRSLRKKSGVDETALKAHFVAYQKRREAAHGDHK